MTHRGLDEIIQYMSRIVNQGLMVAFHPVRLGNETIVPTEARVQNEPDLLGLKPNHWKHLLELILDLVELPFRPATLVHLVDTHSISGQHQVGRECMRAGGSFPLQHQVLHWPCWWLPQTES